MKIRLRRSLKLSLDMGLSVGSKSSSMRYPYYGELLLDWATATTTDSNGADVVEHSLLGGTHALSLPYNAVGALCDVAVSVDLSAMTGFYLKCSKTGETTSNLRVYVAGDDLTHYAYCDFVVEPGVNTFTPHQRSFHRINGFSWATHGAAITVIRFKDTPGIQAAAYPKMIAGESILVGPVQTNPKNRPVFIIFTDDGLASNVTNGAGFPTEYPTSGGNYYSIANHYGIANKLTLAIIPDLIGTAGYLNSTQLATLSNAGCEIVAHGDAGAGNGLVDLETYEAVLAEIQTNVAGINALGYTSTSSLYVLPQGGYDSFVLQACRDAGLQSVRMIGNGDPLAPHTISVGKQAGDKANDKQVWTPTLCPIIETAIQIDGAPTAADIDTYIDEIIACGGVGACYTHGIDAATAVKFDHLCNRLVTERNRGRLSLMTFSQWADQWAIPETWEWNDGTSIDWNTGESIDLN